jgi:hypothetical protein
LEETELYQRDEETQKLVAEYQANPTDELFQQIYEKVKPTIYYVISRFRKSLSNRSYYFWDKSEIKSILLVLLWNEVLKDYDPEKGSFKRFCKLVFTKKLITYKNSQMRKKNVPRNLHLELGYAEESRGEIEDPNNWHDSFLTEDSCDYIMSQVFSEEFSVFEEASLRLKADGYSYKNISDYFRKKEKMKVTHKQIDNAVVRAREKLFRIKWRLKNHERHTGNSSFNIRYE